MPDLPSALLTDVAHVVYLFRDEAGELLYVGVTSNFPLRIATHRAEREWWPQVAHVDTEQFPTRAAANVRETELIKAFHPRHNRTFLPREEAKPALVIRAVRFSRVGVAAVQQLADIEHRIWSDMLRILLCEALDARAAQTKRSGKR